MLQAASESPALADDRCTPLRLTIGTTSPGPRSVKRKFVPWGITSPNIPGTSRVAPSTLQFDLDQIDFGPTRFTGNGVYQ